MPQKPQVDELFKHVKRQKTKHHNDDDPTNGLTRDLLKVLESLLSIVDFAQIVSKNVQSFVSRITTLLRSVVGKFTTTGNSYRLSFASLLSKLLSPIEYLMDQYNEFMYDEYSYDQKLFVTRIYRYLENKWFHYSQLIWNKIRSFFYPDQLKTVESKNKETAPSFTFQMFILSMLLLFWRLMYLRWRLSPDVSQFDDSSLETHVEQMYIDPITKREYDNEARRFYQNRYQNRSYANPQLKQDFFSYFPSNEERRMDLEFRNQNPVGIRRISPSEWSSSGDDYYQSSMMNSYPYSYNQPSSPYYNSSSYYNQNTSNWDRSVYE